jgi:hypothetical protein
LHGHSFVRLPDQGERNVLLPVLADAGIAPVFGGMFVVFLLLALITSIFWLWMLVDALMNEQGVDKVIWVLVILFLHILGALLYFFMRRGARSTRAT